MQKKTLIRLVLSVVIILVTYAGYSIIRHTYRKAKFTQQTLSGDSFNLFSVPDSTLFSIPESDRILLVYFNSECHYCQQEFEQIEQNKDKFANIKVVFFSEQTINQIFDFANRHRFSTDKNFHFTKIDAQHRATVFGLLLQPSFFIYRHHKLVQEIKGKKEIAEILKFFQ